MRSVAASGSGVWVGVLGPRVDLVRLAMDAPTERRSAHIGPGVSVRFEGV